MANYLLNFPFLSLLTMNSQYVLNISIHLSSMYIPNPEIFSIL